MRSMTEDSVFVYDRTWDGLLTAVFDAFYRHQFPVAIIGERTRLLFLQSYIG